MIRNLRESKATLSELVERAARGEEVIITVRGQPKVRLEAIKTASPASLRKWGRDLREARARYSTGVHDTSQSVLDTLRSDRS
jgi:prevent-host-death family protein